MTAATTTNEAETAMTAPAPMTTATTTTTSADWDSGGPLAEERAGLPIFQYRNELVEAALAYQVLIVVGDTGSGKTTQFPQYIHAAKPDMRIVVTQPRRIAAISAATRVAEETGKVVGGSTVGYNIRFESVRSADTKILYVTDGTLLRTVASADPPTLDGFADLVVLDEAHERSLETDVLFGLLRRACQKRPELRVVVMSATLNVDKFSEYFNDAPIFNVPGRMHAVEVFFARKVKMASLKGQIVGKCVEAAMSVHKGEGPGDILIFLTGQQEIETACRLLQAEEENLAPADMKDRSIPVHISLHPIYSALDTPDQRAVFERSRSGARKVVVATNIAQTSVTIPGIRYVIDSGFVKEKMYDPRTGVDALVVMPISKAAATQRAGRAGRTAPGKVFRLYSREAFEGMDEDTTPEIQRSSLIGTVLSLKKIGIDDVLGFEFIDRPEPELVVAALRQLYYLGALDEDGKITPLGITMSNFPTSPQLSLALITASEKHSCAEELLTLVALLSSEDPFLSPRNEELRLEADLEHSKFRHDSGDHIALLRLYDAWLDAGASTRWCRERFIRYRALSSARNVRGQLADVMDRLGMSVRSCRLPRDRRRRDDGLSNFEAVAILKSVCAGFFANTAKRHPQNPYFYHYLSVSGASSGSSASTGEGKLAAAVSSSTASSTSGFLSLYVHPNSCLSTDAIGHRAPGLDWVLYHDVQYVTRVNMRVVSRIDFEWVKEGIERVKKCDLTRLVGGQKIGDDENHKEDAAEDGPEGKKKKRRRSSVGQAKGKGDGATAETKVANAAPTVANTERLQAQKASEAEKARLEREERIRLAKERYQQRKK